jgi:hypothetical protein
MKVKSTGHNHQHSEANKQQVRGKQRTELGNHILQQGGNCDQVRKVDMNTNLDVPGPQVYQKCKKEAISENIALPTAQQRHTCNGGNIWLNDIMNCARAFDASGSPWIHEVTVWPGFSMILQLKEQLEALKLVPPVNRIAHIDASGKLCKLYKHQSADYSAIFNYLIVFKNLAKRNHASQWPSTTIAEMLSSVQSTYAITKFLAFIRNSYNEKYKEPLWFRYMVSDYSWATMHAIITTFYGDKASKYARAIYRLGSSVTTEFEAAKQQLTTCTLIVSCASHTMKRLSNSVKAITSDKDQQELMSDAELD